MKHLERIGMGASVLFEIIRILWGIVLLAIAPLITIDHFVNNTEFTPYLAIVWVSSFLFDLYTLGLMKEKWGD